MLRKDNVYTEVAMTKNDTFAEVTTIHKNTHFYRGIALQGAVTI